MSGEKRSDDETLSQAEYVFLSDGVEYGFGDQATAAKGIIRKYRAVVAALAAAREDNERLRGELLIAKSTARVSERRADAHGPTMGGLERNAQQPPPGTLGGLERARWRG